MTTAIDAPLQLFKCTRINTALPDYKLTDLTQEELLLILRSAPQLEPAVVTKFDAQPDCAKTASADSF